MMVREGVCFVVMSGELPKVVVDVVRVAAFVSEMKSGIVVTY